MRSRLIAQCTFVVSALLFQACVPPGGSAGGSCTLSSGDVVNTYAIFGKWRKIQGYSTPRSQAQLDLNYDILIVEPGTRMCVAEIKNGVPFQTTYRANYDHDIDNKKITINYTEGLGNGSAEGARYSFSGSCNDTHMTLNYDDGSSEVYELYNIQADIGDCDPPAQ